LTVSENPNESAANNRLDVFGWDPGGGIGVFEICVPAKEKNKNMNVPTNSPTTAIMLFRTVSSTLIVGKSEVSESRRARFIVYMGNHTLHCENLSGNLNLHNK
jgi:hypothetical protein